MQIFPVNNIWNTPVDSLPVHSQSAAYLSLIGTSAPLRLDDVMPVNIVTGVPGAPLTITDQGDGGLYPIPSNVKIEAGEDAHALIIDQDTGILYEMFLLSGGPGAWVASSAAKWDLGSNALRKDGDTSADAAGLPITPGLLRYDEVLAGTVTHALRFTAPHTQGNGVYVWPARHYASHNPDGPPMGTRVRLMASFDVSTFTPRQQVILNGLKKYGAMLADNGMPWGMQKQDDARWDPNEIVGLHAVLGSAMEVVDCSSLMNDPNSGAAGTLPPGILATDQLGRPTAITLGPGLKIVNNALILSDGFQSRINCGGPVAGSFSADQFFTGGTPQTSPVPLPAGTPAYFQSNRYGVFKYQIPVPDGQYHVILHFLENSSVITGAGQRVFNVAINGAQVLSNFDIYAAAGFNASVDRTFSTSASGGGGILLQFSTVVRNALISAIEVVS